jgi:hypothetical protein
MEHFNRNLQFSNTEQAMSKPVMPHKQLKYRYQRGDDAFLSVTTSLLNVHTHYPSKRHLPFLCFVQVKYTTPFSNLYGWLKSTSVIDTNYTSQMIK